MDSQKEKITLIDHLNASLLMLVTPEYKSLRATRTDNGYLEIPTFETPNPMPLSHVVVKNTRIRYAYSPSVNKPSLVMLSPFPQSIVAYAAIWPILDQHFNLYAFDMPGFGHSEGGVEFMTFKAQGEFLKLLIDHFKINDPHIVGPDVGMPAALYCASNYPDSIKSLLIGDGPAISPSSNASSLRKMVNSRFWRTVFRLTGSGALLATANKIGYTNYCPNHDEVADYISAYRTRMSAAMSWFRDYNINIETVDPLLKSIATPTLVFWGEQDAILELTNGERIVERMPNAEMLVFKNTGHFCYQDRYVEFSAMVVSWVRAND